MEIVAIVNQKGGVGKSTTAFNLGVGLSSKGFKVLFVDCDAQGNLSDTARADDSELTVIDLLRGKAKAENAIQRGERWDIIPSSSVLAGADIIISGRGKENRLKEALEPVKERYDYIILDTPPALGVIMTNALTAASVAVIPTQADRYSLKGIAELYTTIGAVRKHSNATLRIKGVLLTRHNARAVLTREIVEVLEETAQKLGTKLFAAKIREAVAIKESQTQREDIFTCAPKSNAAKDYRAFIDEFLRS